MEHIFHSIPYILILQTLMNSLGCSVATYDKICIIILSSH